MELLSDDDEPQGVRLGLVERTLAGLPVRKRQVRFSDCKDLDFRHRICVCVYREGGIPGGKAQSMGTDPGYVADLANAVVFVPCCDVFCTRLSAWNGIFSGPVVGGRLLAPLHGDMYQELRVSAHRYVGISRVVDRL